MCERIILAWADDRPTIPNFVTARTLGFSFPAHPYAFFGVGVGLVGVVVGHVGVVHATAHPVLF